MSNNITNEVSFAKRLLDPRYAAVDTFLQSCATAWDNITGVNKMPNTDDRPPESAPETRKEMLRYMERFGRWARKLTDDDLGMVVAFCANVQMAWTDGQKPADDLTAQVEAGTVPIELPGLGGDNDTAN